MIPFFTYPLALLALASIPALAAIYILRNRFRRRQVSSLMLWQFHLQSKAGGAKVHRLQLPFLFLLELLALLLLVTAATGPRWELPQATRPLIVVLDDSFSMRAGGALESPQAKARAYFEALFKRQPPLSVRLIAAGSEPRLLGGSVRTWTEIDGLLQSWTCLSASASLERAITLASEIGNLQANILVLTDRAPESVDLSNGRWQWRAFGSTQENLAFVNASRTVFADVDRCLLEVANFSGQAKGAVVQVRSGTNLLQTARIDLEARARQRLVFNLPASTPAIQAGLAEDALETDNAVHLLSPPRRRVRVQLAVTNETWQGLMSQTMEATGLRAAISEQPEIVVHSAPSAALATNAWSLRWLGGEKTVAYTGPFVIDPAHPLAQGLGLNGVLWAGVEATNIQNAVPIIAAGNVPLLAVREDAFGRPHLILNFQPELSTLQYSPDWPILLWNLLQWRAESHPGLREHNVRQGSEVLLRTTGEAVSVTWPDGTVKTFPQPGSQLSLETPLPGQYSVAMGLSTFEFAVNPLAADESDLLSCAAGQWGEWEDAEQKRFEHASVLWVFVLAAFGVMVAHLWLIARGKGGA